MIMPQQVFEGLNLLTVIISVCPHDDTTPVFDSKIATIRKKGEDDGYTCLPSKDSDATKFIKKGNSCTTPQNTSVKTVVQMLALRLIFNLRGWFSTAPLQWQTASEADKEDLEFVNNLIVEWLFQKVPDRAAILFPW